MLTYIYVSLQILLNPKCWVLSNKYNRQWDKRLNFWIDNHVEIKEYQHDPEAQYCIMINGRQVIISSFPDNYGTRVNGAAIGRPSRRTMFKLKRLVEDFRIYG